MEEEPGLRATFPWTRSPPPPAPTLEELPWFPLRIGRPRPLPGLAGLPSQPLRGPGFEAQDFVDFVEGQPAARRGQTRHRPPP